MRPNIFILKLFHIAGTWKLASCSISVFDRSQSESWIFDTSSSRFTKY